MVQVFFDSTDGARIPMFIVRKKGAAGAAGVGAGEGKDAAAAPAPTLMYGYGGFNISITPSFSAMRIGWLHHFSGVLAVVNLRGGGGMGKSGTRMGRCTRSSTCSMISSVQEKNWYVKASCLIE